MEQKSLFFIELFVLLRAYSVFSTRADLYLNDWELSVVKSALLFGASSLLKYHARPDVSEQLSLYSIKLYIGIAM